VAAIANHRQLPLLGLSLTPQGVKFKFGRAVGGLTLPCVKLSLRLADEPQYDFEAHRVEPPYRAVGSRPNLFSILDRPGLHLL